MKQLLYLFSILLLVGCNPVVKNRAKPTDAEMAQATLAFAELDGALKADNGALWNHSLAGPLMMVNNETRVIIANQADEKGLLKPYGKLFTGLFPQELIIANTSLDWNGMQWTQVGLPLPDTKEERLSLLMHESFHRIQPAIGFAHHQEIQSVHLETKWGRVFLKMELEALKMALSETNADDHIKNALRFRLYRYQLFPEAKNAENSLEIHEGVAEFTGTILSGRSNEELKKHYITKIDWFYTHPGFVRSFAYYTIPVYGFFLHQSHPQWNLSLNELSNLTDVIGGYYNIKNTPLKETEIMELGQLYNMDSILEFESNREEMRLAKVEKWKAQFLGNDVLILGLENMNIGFNPSNITPLESYGTVYPNLRITDNWGILEVDSCGALINPQWKFVTISAPTTVTDTLITGKGWRIIPNEGWKLETRDKKYFLVLQ